MERLSCAGRWAKDPITRSHLVLAQTHLAPALTEAEIWSDHVACSQGQFESGFHGPGLGSQWGRPHVHCSPTCLVK